MTGAQGGRERHGGGRWHRILYAAALLLAVLGSGIFAYGFLPRWSSSARSPATTVGWSSPGSAASVTRPAET